MGKTRDLFKKIGDIKGTVHVRMGKIKDRNCKDLQKQKILRRGGKNTQTILKRSNDLENHDGVDTNLKLDILECEVKWALESITMNKASGGGWNSSGTISNPERRCCESAALNMPTNLENSAVATGLEKVSVHSNPKERQCQRMLKVPHNCFHLTC